MSVLCAFWYEKQNRMIEEKPNFLFLCCEFFVKDLNFILQGSFLCDHSQEIGDIMLTQIMP